MKKLINILCAVILLCSAANICLAAEEIDFDTSIATAIQAAKDKDSKTVLSITLDLLKSQQMDNNQTAQTYYLRAWAYHKIIRDYREAIYLYTQSIDKKADDSWTVSSLINRASCYGLMRKFDRALEDINRALEIMPDNPTALGQKKALMKARDYEQDKAGVGPVIK